MLGGLSITDAGDAFLGGRAQFEEWLQEFETAWYAPLGMMQLGMMWAQLPDEVKAQLQAMVPEAYADVESLVNSQLSMGNGQGG